MVKILIIDGQRSVRNILKEKLEFEGYIAEYAGDLHAACDMYGKIPYEVVICEDNFFYEHISSQNHVLLKSVVIVTSGAPSIDGAVKAVRNGAFDFVSKPIDMNYLLAAVKRADEHTDSGMAAKTVNASTMIAKTRSRNVVRIGQIVGNSTPISHVKSLIDKVAPSDARVLITGPNGTGKELVAHWLHEKSHRCHAPFVEVNCAAIPSELIESELFGHEKGAFTSAIKQRKGKFEQANGGTLFLDEIGDMSLLAQAKVLRALQENRISRVGSDHDIVIDVRIIAATNKSLKEEIRKGTFREDLYHRLSVIVIPIPPLVERIEDIPLLVDHFVEHISAEHGISPKSIDQQAIDELKTMDWTGNIRELRNVVERLIILGGDNITFDDVRAYASGV